LRKGKTSSEFGRGGELNTIIGKGTAIDGNLRVQNSLRIDGFVRGDITTTDTVIVGKEGGVEGIIRAKHVLLAGRITGNVAATGKVFLEATASVYGDVKATRLVVDEGALFDGKCKMKERAKNGGKDEVELIEDGNNSSLNG
jgi:cytoskeletal protein CcmA (bactofilin family)